MIRLSATTWNCADALQNKRVELAELASDLLCIQEVRRKAFEQIAPDYPYAFYTQSETARGIATFVSGKWSAKQNELSLYKNDKCFHYLTLSQGSIEIDVLNVWVKPKEDYVRPCLRALTKFLKLSKAPYKMVLGDLNQNAIFDKARSPKKHFARTYKLFNEQYLTSAYHSKNNEGFGQEKSPTHFLYYDKNKPYHLDYIFASSSMQLKNCTVGGFDKWVGARRSDHVPMQAEYEL